MLPGMHVGSRFAGAGPGAWRNREAMLEIAQFVADDALC